MEIKDKTIKEIDNLTGDELLAVYELILSMKREKVLTKSSTAYLSVRELLKSLEGSLADDIILMREDRL